MTHVDIVVKVLCGTIILSIVSAQFPTPFYPRKVWWTKRVTREFYTAGRLSTRQMKYAAETGFKSIVSLINTDTSGRFGEEYLPGTGESRHLAEKVLGVKFHATPTDLDWWTVDALKEFSAVTKGLPKPILVFCNDTYVSTLTVLIHVSKTETPSGKDTANHIFRLGRAMGHEYETDDRVTSLVSTITGQRLDEKAAKPSGDLPDWKKYWPAKYVSSTFFDAGQIWRSHIPRIREAGFKAVVNMRRGLTLPDSDTPSQEEVTLINIPDGTETYFKGERQFILRLLETQKDPNKTTDYIYPGSPWTVELQNDEEFGDKVGYNEEIERSAFEEAGIRYYHISAPYPCGQECVEIFHANKDRLVDIARQHGPVLMHCTIGYRTGFFSLLMEAYMSCRDFDWLIGQAHVIGYDFDSEYTKSDYVALRDALAAPRHHCQL
ncbi:uncharacterized protein LOC144450696 [Glandiceps talaboti]